MLAKSDSKPLRLFSLCVGPLQG